MGKYARRLLLPLALICVRVSTPAQGAGGRFDLTGPSIDVHVQRKDKSLPIAMVPNLKAGDKLTIHADLPASQSVKLILVVAFLRGTTNPPPDHWFTKINTWDKKVHGEGTTVEVPADAQQALLFLAPETGGDFATLKSAIRGRPGVFVRAAQDLNEASFEQARIERYLEAIRRVPAGSPAELLDHSHKLAATLNLKPNEDCFKKAPEQQLSCLRQSGSQVLLDDGHGQTLASMIASGDSANLIGAVAGTPMATSGGAGAYSAYVGTLIDVVRLMSGLHTAQFQYIPAIAFPSNEALNLRLNTAPSFHNPKSVIVVALPAIQPSAAPPLRLQDPTHVSCLLQPAMVLPLEGAPLVFATGFAHDLVLHLNGSTHNGKSDLPLIPDAYEGGLVLAEHDPRKPLEPGTATAAAAGDSGSVADAKPKELGNDDINITGTLRGMWGFDVFEGLTVPLQQKDAVAWSAAARNDLYAGRSNQLVLHANGAACTSSIDLDVPGAHDQPLAWKQISAARGAGPVPALEVKLPLEKANPGSLNLLVHQFGTDSVTKVAVKAYSDRTQVGEARIHAGDLYATLSGSGLGEVQSLHIGDTEFLPVAGSQNSDVKELRLSAKRDPKADRQGAVWTKPGNSGNATALLRDGRSLPLTFTVDAPRPSLEVLSKSVRLEPQSGIPLNLGNTGDLPSNSRITFVLHTDFPSRFLRTEKVEVALADGSLRTLLSLEDGSLMLQDAATALAFLSPAKTFGASAFGPLQMRPVMSDGTVGDWIPLDTLVRTPAIAAFTCGRSASRTSANGTTNGAGTSENTCAVTGSNLFLIESVATDREFTSAVPVPTGFSADTLTVPRPEDGHSLFLKLRDDPANVIEMALQPGR